MEDLSVSWCSISDGTWGISPDSTATALEDLAALHVRFEDRHRREDRGAVGAACGRCPGSREGPCFATVSTTITIGSATRWPRPPRSTSNTRAGSSSLWANGPGPATVVHGDPHIGNLFDDDGRTGFLDWGVMSVARFPVRDASYFIDVAIADREPAHGRGDLCVTMSKPARPWAANRSFGTKHGRPIGCMRSTASSPRARSRRSRPTPPGRDASSPMPSWPG